MNPREVAAVLAEIGALSDLAGEDPFRARAYTAAARSMERSTADLAALSAAGRLTTLPSIGPALAETIRELVETGTSSIREALRSRVPPGLHEMVRVPGLGPRRARTLYDRMGIESLDALEAAARAGEIAKLSGFGAKTEQKILSGVAFLRIERGRRLHPHALELGAHFLEWLRAHPAVEAADLAGDVRRRTEVSASADLVAATTEPESVLRAFVQVVGATARVEGEGRAAGELSDGFRVRLRCVTPPRYVAAMVWETGSGAHLSELAPALEAAGLTLGPEGLRRAGRALRPRDEEALYRRAGLAYIPPELREGRGEVERAAAGPPPKLVEWSDLHGTFHCHTTASDGRGTLAEMAEAARALGWSYLGIADHSRSAAYAGGLSEAAVRKQQREIEAWNAANGGEGAERFRILKGIEADILTDGSLDYPDELLATFDFVVGSVHSGFGMDEREMTDRLLRALESPYLTILGHPTGRLLLRRDGYPLDVRAVIDAAAAHGVAIEINADPRRLDLDWRHLAYAAGKGVRVPINPDAHSTRALENVSYGIDMARKGGLQPAHVLNAMTLEEVESYLAERKQSRPGGPRGRSGSRPR